MIPSEVGQTVSSLASSQTNPFMMLIFIVAPAVLTNACALLAMSTSNRFARAVDRAREIAKQIEGFDNVPQAKLERHVNEFTITEKRGLLLLKALRCFYLPLSSFAMVALVSLLGSAIAILRTQTAEIIIFGFVLLAGLVGVGGLVYGVILLLREMRTAITIMHNRINEIRQNLNRK